MSSPALVYAAEKSVTEISDYALIMAKQKRYGDALKIIQAQSPTYQNSYQLRFTTARILTWAKDYDNARALYETLMRDYPNNSDVLVSYGYLQLFTGNLDKAELTFKDVIDQQPTYLDAHNGLQRTIKARQICPQNYVLDQNGYCLPLVRQ